MIGLEKLIADAKARFPWPSIPWDGSSWWIEDRRFQGRASRHTQALAWTDRESTQTKLNKKTLPSPFIEFAKAVVVVRHVETNRGFSPTLVLLEALRFLEQALRINTGASDPARLLPAHFQIAQGNVRSEIGDRRAYQIGSKLEEISDLVDRYKIAAGPIRHQNALARPRDGDHVDKESQRAGLEKLVDEEVLDALAEISLNPQDDRERLLIRIVDLLVVGGFRIGEVLTLPEKCWIEQAGKDAFNRPIIRSGIRYWPEKGGEPVPKWLPAGAVSIAKKAVEEIELLCRPARQLAAWMEANPGRLKPLAAFGQTQTLSWVEYAKLLGQKRKADVARMVGRNSDSPSPIVYEVESAYLKRYDSRPILIRGRKAQKLSECLAVVFEQFFHSEKTTHTFLVKAIQQGVIEDALGRRPDIQQSIFQRRGMVDSSGQPLVTRTHSFRHWLNTKAHSGGLSDVDLARWMGRRDIRQNEAYKHGTVEQRAAAVRKMILEDKVAGPVAQIYKTLSREDGEAYLEAQVQAAHTTQFGICVHNFAASPCEHHLNCLRGCGDYLRTKGDQDQWTELTKLKDATEKNLEIARAASSDGAYGAGNFVAHNERVLQGVVAALAVDDDPNIPDGKQVKPGS